MFNPKIHNRAVVENEMDDAKPPSKRCKLEVRPLQHNSNQHQQLADILRLNIDCFEELFEYLSIEDISYVGKTCKRLKQIVGYIFQQYFPFELSNYRMKDFRRGKIDNLIEYLDKYCFRRDKDYRYFLELESRLIRVKKLVFNNFQFTATKIESLKEILSKAEEVKIVDGSVDGNIHDDVLIHCTNMKRLSLIGNLNMGTNWIFQKYSNLEEFEWEKINISGLIDFLKLNPNIRKFLTDADNFYPHITSMVFSGVSLDVLVIKFPFQGADKIFMLPNSFIRQLDMLHNHGVFKRLELNFYGRPMQESLNDLGSLNSLVSLKIHENDGIFDLSHLKNLEELYIVNSNQIDNMEILAKNLTKLKRIEFDNADISDILTIINLSANLVCLRVIEMSNRDDNNYFNESTDFLDVPALKKIRDQVIGAKKIMMYVDEDICLETKWKYKKLNFGIIKLMHNSSYTHNVFFQ